MHTFYMMKTTETDRDRLKELCGEMLQELREALAILEYKGVEPLPTWILTKHLRLIRQVIAKAEGVE